MKQLLTFSLALLLTASLCKGDIQKFPLPEVMKPESISLDKTQLYVVEGHQVLIYSLTEKKMVTRFGKAGEGPKEFKLSPMGPPLICIPYPEYLLINSSGKLSYFSLDGKFKKEVRAPQYSVLFAIKDRFIGTGFKQEKQLMYLSICTYDSERQKAGELFVSDITVGPNAQFNHPNPTLDYAVYKDNIYIVTGGMKCVIDVFDINGKKVRRIEKEIENQSINSDYKKKTIAWYKNDSPFKQYFDYLKNRISFKSVFPALKQFFVNDDKIYAVTNKKDQKGRFEVLLLDLTGKELKRIYKKLPAETPLMPPTLHQFVNNRHYKLEENIDDEEWLLSIDTL